MEIYVNQGLMTVYMNWQRERRERNTLYLPPKVSAKFYWLWPSFPRLPGRPGLIGVVISLQRILGSHTHTHTHTHHELGKNNNRCCNHNIICQSAKWCKTMPHIYTISIAMTSSLVTRNTCTLVRDWAYLRDSGRLAVCRCWYLLPAMQKLLDTCKGGTWLWQQFLYHFLWLALRGALSTCTCNQLVSQLSFIFSSSVSILFSLSLSLPLPPSPPLSLSLSLSLPLPPSLTSQLLFYVYYYCIHVIHTETKITQLFYATQFQVERYQGDCEQPSYTSEVRKHSYSAP